MSPNEIFNRGTQSSGRTISTTTYSNKPSYGRVGESLEIIRQEFAAISAEVQTLRMERNEFEAKVAFHVNELNAVRQTICDLEAQHYKVCQGYKEELVSIYHELDTIRRQATSESHSTPRITQLSTLHNDIHSMSDDSLPKPRESFVNRHERYQDRAQDGRNPKRHKLSKEYSGRQSPSSPLPRLQTASHHLGAEPISGSGSLKHDGDQNFAHHDVRREQVKKGNGWNATFYSSQGLRDVNLKHTLNHKSIICCVRFSPDGRYLAVGCNRSTHLHDTESGLKVCSLEEMPSSNRRESYVRSLRFSPDGKLLATGSEDHKIRVWNIEHRKILHTFEGHQQEIYSLDYACDGRFIASGSGDRTIRLWDLTHQQHKVFTIIDTPADADAGVTSITISPDGAFVAAGSLDNKIRVWDITSGALLITLSGHTDSVYSVAFTMDSKGIVSGSLDKTLKHWDISCIAEEVRRGLQENGHSTLSIPYKCTRTLIGHQDFVLSVTVTNDNRWVASGSRDRSVRVWDLCDGSTQFSLQAHKNSVISIDMTPAGKLLASGGGDKLAHIWSYSD